MASALEDYFDPNSPDYITRAHNAIQDLINPDRQDYRNPLPPQDEVIKPYTSPFSGDTGIYDRPTGSAMGDVVLPPPGRFDGSGLKPATPFAPQPSTNQDTRDYNTYRATGQDAPLGLTNISYAGSDPSGGDPWIRQNKVGFPTLTNPDTSPIQWTNELPKVPFGQDPGDVLPGNRERSAATDLNTAVPAHRRAPPSAAAADRAQEVATNQPSQLHPVFAYEAALDQFPVLHQQQLISGPGKQLEYWPPNEPGTPERPRPDYIPIDQAGMELGPNSTPMDILGDIVSHHMVKKDPVIKKHFESFKESLTDDQKEQLQAQYNYAAKNQNETRPYAAWEKASGLPAYFRGYAFGQWPAEFNQKAYTPAQRYHFDRMMDYLRGNQHQSPPSALQ